MDKDKVTSLANAVIETEAEAVRHLKTRIDDSFYQACEHMLACKGRIVVRQVMVTLA